MSARTQGGILVLVGVVVLLVSATADILGIGGFPGVGWKQLAGIAAGVAVAASGMLLLRRRPA